MRELIARAASSTCFGQGQVSTCCALRFAVFGGHAARRRPLDLVRYRPSPLRIELGCHGQAGARQHPLGRSGCQRVRHRRTRKRRDGAPAQDIREKMVSWQAVDTMWTPGMQTREGRLAAATHNTAIQFNKLERAKGIEPSTQPWQGCGLEIVDHLLGGGDSILFEPASPSQARSRELSSPCPKTGHPGLALRAKSRCANDF